jgi:atypical dual specificity phosphatase
MNRLQRHHIAMNFSWLEDGKVAGCRSPRTDEDLQFLASVGIAALVRLASEAETGISPREVEAHGIQDCYEPVDDMCAPSQAQIERIVKYIRARVIEGKRVAVSCAAGYGRTATVLACYLVARGDSAEKAIRTLVRVRPYWSETMKLTTQEDAVFEFHLRLKTGEARL